MAVDLDKVVVDGKRERISFAVPVEVLAGDELARRRQGGIGETLAGLPGIHLDNFGGGASRPVIRGQTVPRIEILSHGANLFDASSVSPDHAITTDPLLLEGIEIMRGPAAVRYGGNASHGVVNLIDGKIPTAVPHEGVSGAAEVRHGTGDAEQTGVARLTAGAGAFAFHAEGAYRESGDYAVPDAYGSRELKDSFAESSSYSIGASWITPRGYLGAAYTHHESAYGLPGHSHRNGVCHTHGLDLHCESHGIWEDPFLGSDDSHTARIRLSSDRFDVRGDHEGLLPGFDHTRIRLSYTDYVHDEIDGPFLFSRYTNEVYDGRLEASHVPVLGFTGTIGVQYTDGTFSGLNYNTAHEGQRDWAFVEPVHYVTRNVGVFLHEQRSFGPLDVEFAARKDWREIHVPVPHFIIPPDGMAEVLEIEQLLGLQPGGYMDIITTGFKEQNPGSRHSPFSVSAGANWNLGGGYSAAVSLGRTERAPSVRELYALGNNLATNSYEVGFAQTWRVSRHLPAARSDVLETTRSFDLTLRKSGGPLEFEIGAFHRNVDEYVFARLIETETEGGSPHHYLVYTAADATFTGMDGQISYRFAPRFLATLFGDYVRTRLRSEDDHLPRIPPMRLGARYEGGWGPWTAELEYYRTFSQDRFASYETQTAGYDMVNATVSYALDVGVGRPLDIYLRGTNLTNELALAHTSFVKDQSPLRGRNVGIGVRYQF